MTSTKTSVQSEISFSESGGNGSGKNGRQHPGSAYDESKIKTLSSLEHIRLRTGMYIGRLGNGSDPDDGIYVLLKEVIDNGVDEHIMGFGKKIEIAIESGPTVKGCGCATTGAASRSARWSSAYRSSTPAPSTTTTFSSSASG